MNFITKTVTVVRCPTCGEFAVLPHFKPISYCEKCHARYIDLPKILAYVATITFCLLVLYRLLGKL